MPEQLAGDELIRNRGTVDRAQRLVAAGAHAVQHLRDQLLANAGFALDQHGLVERRVTPGKKLDVADFGAAPDDRVVLFGFP